MIKIEQVETGLAHYLDAQLVPRLPKNSIYKIIIGTSASIAVRKAGSAIAGLKSNPVVSALGLIDEDDCIDIDLILEELKHQIPDEGIKLEYNKFGKLDLTFTREDVEELHRYIMRGVTL